MEKNILKLTAVSAGLAAVVLAGTVFAAPSYASVKHTSVKTSTASTATTATWSNESYDTTDHHRGGRMHNGVEATLAATITGVPATVTDPEVAEHGALFIAYEYTGAAPTTQPTTGGRPAHFEATTLANGTLTGTLDLHTSKTAGTYTVAVYNSVTSATPVLVTIKVDAAGVATATTSGNLTAVYDATRQTPAFGKWSNGGRGHGGRHR